MIALGLALASGYALGDKEIAFTDLRNRQVLGRRRLVLATEKQFGHELVVKALRADGERFACFGFDGCPRIPGNAIEFFGRNARRFRTSAAGLDNTTI